VRGAGRERSRTARATAARADFDTLDMPALLNALIAAGEKIECSTHGHWRGVNDLEDFRARDFAHAQTPYGAAGTTPEAPA
jgi:phosphoenolpyruvate phosphomutase